MFFTIEPMLNLGKKDCGVPSDGWTATHGPLFLRSSTLSHRKRSGNLHALSNWPAYTHNPELEQNPDPANNEGSAAPFLFTPRLRQDRAANYTMDTGKDCARNSWKHPAPGSRTMKCWNFFYAAFSQEGMSNHSRKL